MPGVDKNKEKRRDNGDFKGDNKDNLRTLRWNWHTTLIYLVYNQRVQFELYFVELRLMS